MATGIVRAAGAGECPDSCWIAVNIHRKDASGEFATSGQVTRAQIEPL
jgi:hypothetical protein